MTGRVRAIAAAAAAGMITCLVLLVVHPDPRLARFGTLPLMAALWAAFAAGAWLPASPMLVTTPRG
jgi:hypothetical protein